MERTPPPLLGFNNNVRHRGRVFHIQTEDSGMRHARIVTHLFADGGRIVRTTRTDYSDVLGRQDTVQVLRQMMKEQHKSMFMDLRAGKLDTLIDEVFGDSENDKLKDPGTGNRQSSSTAEPKSVQAALPDGSSPAGQMAQQAGPCVPERVAAIRDSPGPRAAEVTLQRVVSIGEPRSAAAPSAVTDTVQPASEPAQELPGRGAPAETTPTTHETEARQPAESVPHSQEREGPSIFGGTTSSGQTLDNVILSYLAEGIGEETPQD